VTNYSTDKKNVELGDLQIGDVVKLPRENDWVYVFEIGHDMEGKVSQLSTYRIVNEDRATTGTNAVPLTKESIATVVSEELGFTDPVVEIRSDKLRHVEVKGYNYYVERRAFGTTDAFQKIADNVHHEIGAHDRRYSANTKATINYKNLTSGKPVNRPNIDENDNIAHVVGEKTVPETPKAKTLLNVRDIYLDHAVDYGLISKETFTLLKSNYLTLQEVWHAAQNNVLELPEKTLNQDTASIVKDFTDAFPDSKKRIAESEKVAPKGSDRENIIENDTVYLFVKENKITLDEALKKGWISSNTRDILVDQNDDCKSCIHLEEALRLIGAHRYFVREYTNPDTGEALTPYQASQVSKDVENAYREASKEALSAKQSLAATNLDVVKEDLSSARSAFFSRADIQTSVFVHHDFNQDVIRKLKPQVKAQKEAVQNRDFMTLGITSPEIS